METPTLPDLTTSSDGTLRTLADITRNDAEMAYGLGLVSATDDGRYQTVCHYCYRPVDSADGRSSHIEHRIPVCRGGTSDDPNLVLSCPTCNLSKGRRTPAEWYAASPAAHRLLGLIRWYGSLGDDDACDAFVDALRAGIRIARSEEER